MFTHESKSGKVYMAYDVNCHMADRAFEILTSPAGAAAKYCDEYVCMCLSVCLSVLEHNPEPQMRSLATSCACCLWMWLGPLSAR